MSAGVDVQVFTGSGTWTCRLGHDGPHPRLGAGGSGGRCSSTGGGGGGGGGSHNERWVPVSSLGATETVTVTALAARPRAHNRLARSEGTPPLARG